MAENEPVERHSEHWSEGEDESNDTSNPSVNSEELRNRIALTNAQLHELSKDDGITSLLAQLSSSKPFGTTMTRQLSA
jgi:hypothetical protein